MSLIVTPGRQGHRAPPVEFADAVEQYYRQHGRHARLQWVAPIRTWVIRVELRADDPRMRAWQEGRAEEKPVEQIELVEYKEDAHTIRRDGIRYTVPGYVGYELEELGVSGLLEFLQKADVLTGRGEFESLSAAVREQRDRMREAREKAERAMRSQAVDRAMDRRRSALGIPYLPVGINLRQSASTPAAEAS